MKENLLNIPICLNNEQEWAWKTYAIWKKLSSQIQKYLFSAKHNPVGRVYTKNRIGATRFILHPT